MYKGVILILKRLKATLENICSLALSVGFDACGVAPIHRLDSDAGYMDEWLSRGYHGEMSYLERNCEKRYDPSVLVLGGRAIVVCLLTYEHSGRDYHRTVKSKLYALEAVLKEHFGEGIVSSTHQHIFCDSAPVLERRWCVEAGLGFIGKNRQLIHPELGSMVHPGEIIINVPVLGLCSASAGNAIVSACGDCRQCIEVCPNGALGNAVWDARLCVAYTTHYCVACQDICPYNKQHFINSIVEI